MVNTHSLVMSPLGPVGIASLGSRPWVSSICLAAGLRRNLDKELGGGGNRVLNKIWTFYIILNQL